MKTLLFTLALTTLSTNAFAYDAACTLLVSGGVAFTASNQSPDREYATFEIAQQKGFTFFLRAGHGVARLEAWSNRRLIANTFYSTGRDPKESDNLRLAVRTADGSMLEAQCSNVDATIGR